MKLKYNIVIVKDKYMNEYYVHMSQMFDIITENYYRAKIISVQTLREGSEILTGIIVYRYYEQSLWLQKVKSFKLFKKKEGKK